MDLTDVLDLAAIVCAAIGIGCGVAWAAGALAGFAACFGVLAVAFALVSWSASRS